MLPFKGGSRNFSGQIERGFEANVGFILVCGRMKRCSALGRRSRASGSGQLAERLPQVACRSGFGAVLTHHPHGFLDHREIAGRRAQRRVLEADAKMAAPRHRLADPMIITRVPQRPAKKKQGGS
jgi:hypothetical protein